MLTLLISDRRFESLDMILDREIRPKMSKNLAQHDVIGLLLSC
jgi:hypothetical protein